MPYVKIRNLLEDYAEQYSTPIYLAAVQEHLLHEIYQRGGELVIECDLLDETLRRIKNQEEVDGLATRIRRNAWDHHSARVDNLALVHLCASVMNLAEFVHHKRYLNLDNAGYYAFECAKVITGEPEAGEMMVYSMLMEQINQ